MQSEKPSNRISKSQETKRSDTIGVEVVRNRAGWHINVSLNRRPHRHYGPFEEEMTLPQAFHFLATTMQLTGEI